MTENPQQQGGADEVPSDEQLDVEGPNESTQPSGAPEPQKDRSSAPDDST